MVVNFNLIHFEFYFILLRDFRFYTMHM